MNRYTYQEVELSENTLASHVDYAGQEAVRQVRELARSLKGLRVLHINSTSYGGGVAELLASIVPLMRNAGIDAHWQVMSGLPSAFFNVTKKIHNTLQGSPDNLSGQDWQLYDDTDRALARSLLASATSSETDAWDIVIMHDPQPLAVLSFLELEQPGAARRFARHWVWRCHIDLSTPNPDTWARIWPLVNLYDGVIVTHPAYARQEITPPLFEITPSIDPTSLKNSVMSAPRAEAIVRQFGIDTSRPLLVQVSRFDPWKDPFGVVDAYRLVKAKRPQVQLAMVGSIASDDPEGIAILNRLKIAAGDDGDIHLLSNDDGVHATEVAAFQQHADVVIQKSTREGFGLTITEAMWKGKPVVAGEAVGCRLQITDGEDGFITQSTEECARRVLQLLDDAQLQSSMGIRARSTVRQRFLSTEHVARYLRLFAAYIK